MLRLWELNTSSADTSGMAKPQAEQPTWHRPGLEPDESNFPSSISSSSASGPCNPSASPAMGTCSAIDAEREGQCKRRRTADNDLA